MSTTRTSGLPNVLHIEDQHLLHQLAGLPRQGIARAESDLTKCCGRKNEGNAAPKRALNTVVHEMHVLESHHTEELCRVAHARANAHHRRVIVPGECIVCCAVFVCALALKEGI